MSDYRPIVRETAKKTAAKKTTRKRAAKKAAPPPEVTETPAEPATSEESA